MKTSILLLTILVLSCTGQAAEKQSVVAANPVLIGKWTGQGRFLDVALDKDLGKVPIEVEINKDNTVTGRIGDAKLTQTSIKKARYGFEIHGILYEFTQNHRKLTDRTTNPHHHSYILL